MKIKKLLISIAALAFIASACSKLSKNLDVVGQASIASFNAILQVIPDKVDSDDADFAWVLNAPDKSAKFIWGKDYSGSSPYDIILVFDAKPFLDAGLDINKLPNGIFIDYGNGQLAVGVKLGKDALKYNGAPTPLASYEHIVNLYRSIIGYHAALDHYGITIGDGNLFEWAKDINANDKDIVFVLNPEPFIAAGVNPNKVKGWLFAKVPIDINGKPVEVDKFLKPFNLK
ncbi:MAG: hypothetical protein LBT79_08485 [Elusimicrobiota bacterium]|jgi:hypothetical protein|nr:hypothetical protein [Elusimicrobiota bacterium]